MTRFFLSILLCLSAPAGATGKSADVPTAVPAEPDPLAGAVQLLNNGQEAGAALALAAVVARSGRAAEPGTTASYLLITAYRGEGHFAEALQEAEALLAANPAPVPPAPDTWVLRAEVTGLRDLLKAELQRAQELQAAVEVETDPALKLLQGGDLLRHGGDSPGALARYRAAFAALTPGDAEGAVRLQVERKVLSAFMSLPLPERLASMPPVAFPMLEDPASPVARRIVALTFLKGLADQDPEGPAAARLEKDLQAVVSKQLSATASGPFTATARAALTDLERRRKDAHAATLAPERQFQALAADALADLQTRRATSSLVRAVGAENAGNWTGALAAYRQAAALSAGRTDLPTFRMASEAAARSIPLMQDLALSAGKPSYAPGCAFLGVDATVPRDWRGTLGREAWLLFANYGASDLGGGARLLDGTFSYRVRLGDPKNQPRRWRSAQEAWSYYRGILPLVDPLQPGSRELAFLDDNGEAYPKGCGPDLYLDLSIPAGRHLLSLPLVFSASEQGKAGYSLYLLGSGTGDRAGPVHCLASLFYPYNETPGYVVRAAIEGPGRYTLLIRRQESFNVNLPALFLDPDPRLEPLQPLSGPVSSEELGMAGVVVQPGGDGVSTVTPREGAPGAKDITLLVQEYSRLDGLLANGRKAATSLETAPDPASARVVSAALVAGWAPLADRAAAIAGDEKASGPQREIAAWIALHAVDHCPLRSGSVAPALDRYLILHAALRTPGPETKQSAVSTAAFLRAQVDELRPLAAALRKEGRIALSERIDDEIWNDELQAAQLTEVPKLLNNLPAQHRLIQQFWEMGPRHYLTRQTAFLSLGEGYGAPQPVHLALDAGYAARKMREIMVGLMLSGGTLAGFVPASEGRGVSSPGSSTTGSQRASFYLDIASKDWTELYLPADEPPETIRVPTTEAPIEQPVGAILYAEAGEPLLGSARPVLPRSLESISTPDSGGSAWPGPAEDTTLAVHPNLLRPDQMHRLARAWIDREFYPTEHHAQDLARAALILIALLRDYPAYNRRAEVQTLLQSLPPMPKE